MLIVVFGLPGSGKSYFARRLSERIGIEYVGSDTVRNELGARGKYTDESRLVIYGEIRNRAEAFLSQAKSVVIDATFTVEGSFEMITTLADNFDCALILFRVSADELLIKERLRTRRSDSEANYQVYERLKQLPINPTISYHTLESTNSNVDEMIEKAVAIIKKYDEGRN